MVPKMKSMGINTFFRDTLRAPVQNERWSWGARDHASNRIFLRVWTDQSYFDKDGREWVQVYWVPPRNSHGDPERLGQIKAIQSGAEGFAILCTAVDTQSRPRKIQSFDDQVVLRLGTFTKDGNGTYAEVIKRIPVSVLTADTVLAQDLVEIARTVNRTSREALIAARVGQGQFRADVLKRWQGRCGVTGSETLEIIRASHIKPWRQCTNDERLDSHNGLPLTASLDALFDAGLISFDAVGKMLISELLRHQECVIHGLIGRQLSQKPSERTAKYLRYHREKFAANNLRRVE
jgi:hypothetical protein